MNVNVRQAKKGTNKVTCANQVPSELICKERRELHKKKTKIETLYSYEQNACHRRNIN